MKNFTQFFSLFVLFSFSLKAEIIHFRSPAFSGKIQSESIELTDWQTAMSCRYSIKDKVSEISRFPQTTIKKIDSNNYTLTIKAMNLFEAQQNLELLSCSYKLILVGKNKMNHQTSFGEINLMGQDSGKMTEKELDLIQNKDHFTRVINDKIKDLVISFGSDGGIVLINDEK